MIGNLAFVSPWILAGLAALPVIWWLLRTTPPSPTRIAFPPTRILRELINREKT
ncbi:MAG: BatA domain-containing protein, partial [Hyphomicrobiaceae bacterium]